MPDIAQDLRRQIALGIEAFGFLLEIDAAQIHGPDAVRGFGIRLARDPAEGASRLAFGQKFARIGLGDARDQEMVPARSGMSAGTANTESTETDIASSRPARS